MWHRAGDELTAYDRAHVKLYMRLLDATADGADWREAVQVIFGIDPEAEPDRAKRVHDTASRARGVDDALRLSTICYAGRPTSGHPCPT